MRIFSTELSSINTKDIDQRVKRLEQKVFNIKDDLSKFFVLGRLRTDRSAPTNSADVNDLDLLYDTIFDDPYVYYLVNNSGALEWRRVLLNSF